MTNSNWELHFKLSRKVSCEPQTVESHQSVVYELIVQNNGQKYITGFTISLSANSEKDAKEHGQKQAKQLANYLSISSGLAVFEHLDGIRAMHPSGTQTVSKTFTAGYAIENNAKLTIPDITLFKILNESDPNLSKQIAYTTSAMNLLNADDPRAAIRDLFLACSENPQNNLANSDHYVTCSLMIHHIKEILEM